VTALYTLTDNVCFIEEDQINPSNQSIKSISKKDNQLNEMKLFLFYQLYVLLCITNQKKTNASITIMLITPRVKRMKLNNDVILYLPNELLLSILQYVLHSTTELSLSIRRTCRRFRELIDECVVSSILTKPMHYYVKRCRYKESCVWLQHVLNWTPHDARAEENAALRLSAGNGHLDVCKWLHKTFELTPEDARDNGNSALRWSAENGHLDVCKWLYKTFRLTEDDVLTETNDIIFCSARKGYSDVCKWFYKTLKLTPEYASDNYTFRCSVNVYDLMWLHETFELTAEDD